MSSHMNNRNGGMLITRNERSMPKWVSEQSDRIGPRPPPPPLTPENGHSPAQQPVLPPKNKTQPEPDYEVIEFSNQQYSNAPLRPNSANSGSKTPDNKLKCTLCGSGNPWVTCEECAQQIFCASCDDMFHKHPKRKDHQRKTVEKSRPPLPPKVLPGQPGPQPPVAPPRRNKRGLMTPLMQRKDQGNAMPAPFPVPPSPTPSLKNASWKERFGSLPRGLNLLNRPLPDTPKTPSESSRSTTPKSVFDNIQRPPSVALEKIKSKANATLDRMQVLQQRYRQQKEQMERERSGSVTDQNMSAFDQWSSISQSPSHFRSGSMSSGINSSHQDLMDETNFNLFHQRQMALQHHQMASQRANQLGQRTMSSSVFNLNQINRKQPVSNNGWMNNSMQQAQSMAQLNCANCSQHQSQWNVSHQQHMHMPHDPWSNQLSSQQHLNRSNMSLNVPAGYMMQPQMNGMYPPPTFMNQRGLMQQMYPPPSYMGGMPVMNPGLMGMPPSTSRAASRAGSRMASPAMSRKSVTLRRKQRSNYIDDEATDDEDSDEDDRRSITSARSGVSRSRQRRMSSASQIQLEDDIDSSQSKAHRNRGRNRRDSIAKSVHNDWAPGRKTSSSNNNRSADSGFNSPLKPSRIYSDLDSEGSGTRALVQAKIEQKLKEESQKQKQTKPKRQSQSPTPQKISSSVQTSTIKQEKIEVKQHITEDFNNEPSKPARKPSESEAEEVLDNKKQDIKVKEEAKPESASEEEEEETESEEAESEPESEHEPDQQHVEENDIEEDDLGPPPSTPDHEWECEFCTFVNEANIKICSICCKTPSIKPKKAIKAISPPKQIKTPTVKKEKEQVKEKTKDKESVHDKSGTIKKKPNMSTQSSSSIQNAITNNTETETTKVSTNIQTTKIDSAHNTDDGNDSSTNTLKKKESVEDIWATLDENIQATAHEVTRKAESKISTKVSNACGSSSKSASVERQENNVRQSQPREIGTSPPPQSISTQTYDTLPIHKQEAKDEAPPKQSTQPLYNDIIQQNGFSPSPKIQDLKSFEAEVLNKIHNISHVPSHHHYQHNYHHANHHPMYSYSNERQRYRSNNDLRMDDAMSMDFENFNGLGRRQPSISELMLLQKTNSQMHSPLGGSIYDLPYRELSSLRLNDMDNHKESDLYKYTTEELNAALKYCGPDMHPLVWLRDNWPKLIQTVQSLATKYGQERAENTIGTISQMEARDALRLHTGNIWQAVSECIEQRQRKYRDISTKGNFSREDIVTALTSHQGNLELALIDLGRTQLKPFLMRIWGSPGGVENESGSLPLPSSPQSPQSTHLNMDKDIHNFLSANASECMQTPIATGAYPNNNQMPSPFDLPASLNSPYENNNHMLDNTSSYSADSKDFANSPLPLDESILGNKNVLKDLETLIGNMETNQQNQNNPILRSINDIISNINPKIENEYDSESMRILTKSPITSPKLKTTPKDNNAENEADVKNFVWQHIQEIVPNLVQQVEMELMEDLEDKLRSNEHSEKEREITPEPKPEPIQIATPAPPPPPPIDQEEFLMEEVIKPNIKNASIREELPPQFVYSSEIATFQLAFDKGLEREHEDEFQFESLEEASKQIYKMFIAPQIEQEELAIEDNVQEIGEANNIEQPENINSEEVHIQEKEFYKAQTPLGEPETQNTVKQPKYFAVPIAQIEIASSSKKMQSSNQEAPSSTTVLVAISSSPPLDKIDDNNKIPNSSEKVISEESAVQPVSSSLPSSSEGSTLQGTNLPISTNFEEKSESQQQEQLNSSNERSADTSDNVVNSTLTNLITPVPDTTPASEKITPTILSNNEKSLALESTEELVMSIVLPTEENFDTKPSTSNQKRKQNKEAKARAKNVNQYKRTTNKDLSKVLEQAEAEAVKDTNSTQNTENSNISKSLAKDVSTTSQISEITQPISTHINEHDSGSLDNKIKTPDNHINTTEEATENITSIPSVQPIQSNDQNETVSINEIKPLTNESPIATNKRTSKIPVRRTASNKSLINSSTVSNQIKTNAHITEQEPIQPIQLAAIQTEISQTSSEREDLPGEEEDSEEEELYSIGSESSATEVTSSRADQFQSPTTTSEMFLVIQQEGIDNSTIAPSTSSSTLHSIISQSSGLKSPTEFIPSGDPAKQNLTELVEDTQRLIKQMKDEISIDDFESSTDEGEDDYTDEYSDEYDEEEGEEEEYDEDWEEEEDEDDEEYDDITEEDITEANEDISMEGEHQSPLPIQEYQDLRDTQNSSALSNITESSDHSQTLLSDHFEQDEPQFNSEISVTENQIISVKETAAFVETENNFPELPVETVINSTSQNSMQFIESENSVPEIPVESVLTHEQILTTQQQSNIQSNSEDITSSGSDLKDIISSSINIANDVESENNLPEFPVEVIVDKSAAVEQNHSESSVNLSQNHETSSESKKELPTTSKQEIQSGSVKETNSVENPEESSNELNSMDQEKVVTLQDTVSTLQTEEESEISSGTGITTTQINAPLLDETNIQQTSSELQVNNSASTSTVATKKSSDTTDDNKPSTSQTIEAKSPKNDKDNIPSTSRGTNAKLTETKKKLNEDIKTSVKKSLAASKIPKPKEIRKEQKPKDTPAPTKPQNEFKKKLYTRSKSFSGPPIAITSVKTISQKFATQNTTTPTTAPKNYPTVARKSSIVEAINKLTKPNITQEKPAVSSLFKSRTQPRIPKKKYHETCFSDDDYESSSSEEEPEPLEVRQRKFSVPVFRAYPNVQEPEEVKTEELVKKFMEEELTATIAEAQIAAALVAMKFQQDVSLWAAKECSDLDHAIDLLKQECELCSGTYALNQIVSMLKCTHKCCKQCAKTYFTVQITERSINDCSCPFCKLPELHNQTEHEDENLEYFSNLDIFLKSILEPEVHELFQRKLRDRTLLKDPNFKWCMKCSSGFFARPKQKRLICPDCGSVTCAQCRKTWQKQHEGISCDQYAEWEAGNDPEIQAKGVQQHLEQNGIDCPKCKFRYSLARGGCMHFTCTQCKFEFCYGCAKPFMMGAKCTISSYCAKLGLHAHHPRNCLFYLRDKLPVQLQILLKNNNVSFEVDPIESSESVDDNEPSSSKKKELLCPIPIQKETPTGLVDTRCNGDVPEKHAGMCRTHYVEYLTAKVAKAKIDPLPIFDLTDCVQELRRRGIALPERGPWDTDEIYKTMCTEVIQKNIPLNIE